MPAVSPSFSRSRFSTRVLETRSNITFNRGVPFTVTGSTCMAGAYSYEQALHVIRHLGLPMSSIEEMFRRMVFNIIARNQDDHVKNIAFLMDKSGTWSLAPAFDTTYSFNPSGTWTASHQMTLNGKRDGFTLEDFKAYARTASMKRGRAEAIIKEVREKVKHWRNYAEEAGVPSSGVTRYRIRFAWRS